MKVAKVTKRLLYDSFTFTCLENELQSIIADEIEESRLDGEVSISFSIELKEVTEVEYNALPEFEG